MPANINVPLSAIRKPEVESADNGLTPRDLAAGIARVKGARREGIRTGQWLTLDQAERLLSAPNPATTKGKRDRALLAVLIGCCPQAQASLGHASITTTERYLGVRQDRRLSGYWTRVGS